MCFVIRFIPFVITYWSFDVWSLMPFVITNWSFDVLGLIIDAFGELRDQLEQVKEDMEVKFSSGLNVASLCRGIF